MYNLSLNLKLKETEKTEVCRQTYTFRYLRYTDIIFDLSEFELPKLNCISLSFNMKRKLFTMMSLRVKCNCCG